MVSFPQLQRERKDVDMKLLNKPALAAVGGGLFALAVAVSATQAATAAGIGTSTRANARVAVDAPVSFERRGIGGAHVRATAATYIGITEAALRAELEAGKSLADVAVANGKTRDGLIAALTATASQAIGTLVDHKGLGKHAGPGGPAHGALMKGDPFAVASTYLGISQADLKMRIHAGETLAAIAKATPGKSRDGLVAAIVADSTAKIDAAVTAGTITADQATRLKATLTEHAGRLVDHTGRGGPKGGRGRP